MGQHVVTWIKNYFGMHCEVMPTSGHLHLLDKYIGDELFRIYKDEMEYQGEHYVCYSQFSRLWKLKLTMY